MGGFAGIDPTILALRRLGPGMLSELAWSLLRGSTRSISEDATRAIRRLDRPLRVENLELVPPRDPFVLVANHYQAPGLWIVWVAAALSACVSEARAPAGRNLHWLAISEWRWFELGGRWVPNPLTALLFPRACRLWGLIPTPARPSDVAGRARALRQLLAYLGRPRRTDRAPEPVALLPEGHATVALEEAMPSSGAFLQRVNALGVPLLPAGVHQHQGTLVIRFGSPFRLGDPPTSESHDLDAWARGEVMVRIARLLPRELWGVYSEEVEEGEPAPGEPRGTRGTPGS